MNRYRDYCRSCVTLSLCATVLFSGCSSDGRSRFWEPMHGYFPDSIASANAMGLLVSEYKPEPGVVDVGGVTVTIHEAWVEANSKYIWRNFLWRLTRDDGERIVLSVDLDDAWRVKLHLKESGDYFVLAASGGVCVWYCVVPVASDRIALKLTNPQNNATQSMILHRKTWPIKAP